METIWGRPPPRVLGAPADHLVIQRHITPHPAGAIQERLRRDTGGLGGGKGVEQHRRALGRVQSADEADPQRRGRIQAQFDGVAGIVDDSLDRHVPEIAVLQVAVQD